MVSAEDRVLADMAKQQIRFEAQLKTGDPVFVSWVVGRWPYSGMAQVVRVNKYTITVKLTEDVNPYDHSWNYYKAGNKLVIPRFGDRSWSQRFTIMVPPDFEAQL
jgi:hypothetical protein